jgi:hypothetical protein
MGHGETAKRVWNIDVSYEECLLIEATEMR